MVCIAKEAVDLRKEEIALLLQTSSLERSQPFAGNDSPKQDEYSLVLKDIHIVKCRKMWWWYFKNTLGILNFAVRPSVPSKIMFCLCYPI